MLTARATGQSARFWDGEEHCESRNNRTHHETQDLRPAAVSHPHRLPLVVAGSAPVGIPLWAFLPSLPCFSSPKRSRSVGPRLGYEVQTVGQPPICNSAFFLSPPAEGQFNHTMPSRILSNSTAFWAAFWRKKAGRPQPSRRNAVYLMGSPASFLALISRRASR